MAAFYLLFSLVTFFSDTGTIHLTVQDIQTAKGSMKIAVFNSADSFLEDDKAIQAYSVPVEDNQDLTVSFDPLPYGTYTIAIFHDVNDNGKLDTNFMGIPKEPYGFSNNARSKWGPPKYEAARFDLQEAEVRTFITVKSWIKQ